jgi:hypothetical protein
MRMTAKTGLAVLVGICACWVPACGSVPSPAGGTAPGSTPLRGTVSPVGTGGFPASAGPTSPAPRPTVNAPAILTEADSGKTVRLSAGQSVTVVLRPRSALSWHVPVVIGTAVLRTGASGGYPGQAPARAIFRAQRPGRAILVAGDDAACLHSQRGCKIRQRMWRVVVIVAG